MQESQASIYLLFVKSMKNQRHIGIGTTQQCQIVAIVQHTFSRGSVPGLTIMVKILGVRDHDVIPQEFEGLIKDLTHAGEFSRVEDIGRIHDNLQMRGVHLVEQATSLRG